MAGDTNSVGDFIRSVWSSLVSREGKMFEALLACRDTNDGTVEKMFQDFKTSRERWGNPDVYTQNGEHLNKTLDFISVLTRTYEETDDSIIRRNKCVFYRLGETLWGDYWNCLKVLRDYLQSDRVYIVNNTNPISQNLILNHEFETESNWVFTGNARRSKASRFSTAYGLEMNSDGTCSQTVQLSANKTYFLHFFLNGNCKVKISDSTGKCWIPDAKTFGSWIVTDSYFHFSTDDWDNQSLYFITASNTEITVTFEYEEKNAYIDYVRLFEKQPYPTFTVIGEFEGEYSDDTASLAPYKDDPVKRPDYDLAGYTTEGTVDVDPEKAIDYNRADYIALSAVNDEESPALSQEKDDIEYKDHPFADYFDETIPMTAEAPEGPDGIRNDNFKSIDYEIMSYWNQAYIFGAGGMSSNAVYDEIINILKAAGTTHYVEMLVKETDE